MEKQRVRKRLDRTSISISDVASHAEYRMRLPDETDKRQAHSIRVGDVLLSIPNRV